MSSMVASLSAVTVEYRAAANPERLRYQRSCCPSRAPRVVRRRSSAGCWRASRSADHGVGTADSQAVAGVASGIVDPLRTRHLVEVDVRILGNWPQPILCDSRLPTAVAGRADLGRPGGQPDQPRECFRGGARGMVRAREHGAAGDVCLRRGDVVIEGRAPVSGSGHG